jgi:hypothetical protein
MKNLKKINYKWHNRRLSLIHDANFEDRGSTFELRCFFPEHSANFATIKKRRQDRHQVLTCKISDKTATILSLAIQKYFLTKKSYQQGNGDVKEIEL